MTERKNVMEEIVCGLVSFMLHSPDYQTFCRCKQCASEVEALALNSLPPKYVASAEARNIVFEQINRPENIEYVNKQIIKALHAVSKKPNHL